VAAKSDVDVKKYKLIAPHADMIANIQVS